MKEEIRCVICGTELTGGLDTYGELDEPLCRECFHELIAKNPIAQSLFGIVAGLTDTEEFPE